jgi:D-galacturonate reductase
VHSQQRCFVQAHNGEVTIDQAHRGYSVATESDGFKSANPLFMKYSPSNGKFVGQRGYGYRSFEDFIRAATKINTGNASPTDFDDGSLATIRTTTQSTAILEAGARSLQQGGCPVGIRYHTASGGSVGELSFTPLSIDSPKEHLLE